MVASMYARGEGVEKDYVEAVKWWREAAEQGDVASEYQLGASYLEGTGVRKNLAEAVRWIRSAAEKGHGEAQNYLEHFLFR